VNRAPKFVFCGVEALNGATDSTKVSRVLPRERAGFNRVEVRACFIRELLKFNRRAFDHVPYPRNRMNFERSGMA